ncbi:Bardet-Biedl syndrome 1 protein homolog isoform X1 [Hydra vulgaris]|uniref:Bardet-Biedl syndrome 1 protein homolog isoform X1 n=1 Tax=Hydra vulgaris TaxID=6087 RepID=UPI001F5EE3CC|nr:Bardet-Biedl syndrome 1 protein homolog [Hydra vulgaris]
MSIVTMVANEVNIESKSKQWLDAHYNPVASLYTFGSCIELADLHADGEYKLIIADLGTGSYSMKLRIFKGTAILSESSITDLPTAVVSFNMDSVEPRTPAIAVASGPFVYIYKNLRPYFKFSLPLIEVSPMENDIWNQAKEDKIDVHVLREMLYNLREENGVSALTVRSLKFLQLPLEEAESFAAVHKFAPLKRQSIITCMKSLTKSASEEIGISCLVVASENQDLFILDTEAFTILEKMTVSSVPVFLAVTGLFDVDYRILIACRNAKVYSLKKGQSEAKLCIEMQSPIVGLERVGKNIALACVDNTVTCFSNKSKKLWTIHLPALVTTISVLNHKARGYRALMVALENCQVHIYKDKTLCDIINTPDVVTGLKFGRFGREDGTLVMTTKGGGLIIKILKRTSNLENTNLSNEKRNPVLTTLNVPRKTKLFLDQALREREDPIGMHQTFQSELFKLKLSTARHYVKTLETKLNPLSFSKTTPIKFSVQVQGFGPGFKLLMSLQNTSTSVVPRDLLISFLTDLKIYNIANPLIEVPILIPGLLYNFETFVEAISDKGIADKIKVFVLRRYEPSPVVCAVINMPVSDVTEIA